MSIEPYLNGRESGFSVKFTLTSIDVKLVFAEYRKSDNIVVYMAPAYQFGSNNTISDEIYQGHFQNQSYAYNETANFIVETLRNGYNPNA